MDQGLIALNIYLKLDFILILHWPIVKQFYKHSNKNIRLFLQFYLEMLSVNEQTNVWQKLSTEELQIYVDPDKHFWGCPVTLQYHTC